MSDREPGRPTPGTSLTTQSRPANVNRLVSAVSDLDIVADVAAGKLLRSDVDIEWLMPLAPERPDDLPHPTLTRWINLFRGELETVQRARNNIVFDEYIEDDNLAAAADIAERLRGLAERAGRASAETS